MQTTMILRSDEHTLELNLGNEIVSKYKKIQEIVYQDLEYELILNLPPDEIIEVSVLVNNDDSAWQEYIVMHSDSTRIEFTKKMGFNLLFGMAQFFVLLTLSDGTEKLMFSETLSVAVRENKKGIQDSLSEMISDILRKQSDFLYRGKIISDSGRRLYKNSKINKEMDLLDRILYTYKINFPYFKSGLRYRMESATKIDNFERMSSLNPQTINYIVSHPEQLQQVKYKTGIYIQGYNFQPKKTLVSTVYENSNIYENRVIIGFLSYLKTYLTTKKTLAQQILAHSNTIIESKTTLKPGYILSDEMINLFITTDLEKYICEVETKLKETQKVYIQYRRIFNCEEEPITKVPQATTIFQNVHYYRSIFSQINGWFSMGEYDLSEERKILSFVTADQIYEYYCLLSIFESLNELGYTEDINKRHSYEYKLASKYFKEILEDNTFTFFNGENKVIIYSQPVIYSRYSDTTNGITLFRTDGSYYRPDFIIKYVTKDRGNHYAILDAKWRSHYTLDFKEMVYKYVYSIADDSGTSGRRFMWILKGKTDSAKPAIYRHNKGLISKNKGKVFENTTGIVEVTPKSGIRNLTDILSVFLTE